MKKTFVILILLSLINTCYSQIIKGKIMDSNTQTGIAFAAVYFSGTSTGTYTDKNGYFELDISRFKSMPLIISSLGHYSFTLTDFSFNKPYFIYLTPKDYELGEVVISAKSNALQRRRNLNTFKREFLGTTSNARSCRLENENDVILTFKSSSDTLKATSINPIIIYNNTLGYKIVYYLDKFEYSESEKYLLIIGNYIFIADTTNFIRLQDLFNRRRQSAFLGSRMHFFRSLWENNLDQAGFAVTDSSNSILTYDKIVTQTDSLSKYLRHSGTLFVKYHSAFLQQSEILVVKDYVFFDENGFFDPLGVVWQGAMASQRTGDLLPFEYKQSENNH